MSPAAFDAALTFGYTKKPEETWHFYENLLQLPLVLDQGGCRIWRVAGSGYLGFCHREKAESPAGVILTLVTEDVDGWAARLREAGVPFEKDPAYNPDYKIYHCFLRDPNGYLVEIQRFEDERWPG